MIVHDIFQSQQSVNGLEVVRQTVIGAVEVEPFVFSSRPEIPLPGDEEAMSVAEIVVERVAVSQFAVVIVEIAVERVVHLVIEQIVCVFVRWTGRRLRLKSRGASKG